MYNDIKWATEWKLNPKKTKKINIRKLYKITYNNMLIVITYYLSKYLCVEKSTIGDNLNHIIQIRNKKEQLYHIIYHLYRLIKENDFRIYNVFKSPMAPVTFKISLLYILNPKITKWELNHIRNILQKLGLHKNATQKEMIWFVRNNYKYALD
jgi:hypothetical protein